MGMKRLIKKASYYITLHNCIAKDGSPIELIARIVAGRLRYSIVIECQYHNFSFYDGDSFDDAFDLYTAIIAKLYNVIIMEQVIKQKQTLLFKAKKLLKESAEDIFCKRNTLYFTKHLFLGINEGC